MPEPGSPAVSVPASEVPGDPALPPPEFNTGVAHPARVYNYWLGGNVNYASDRDLGDAVIAVVPSIPTAVRANRAFLSRAVRYLSQEAGIRQFLDIGTGIPAVANVHEVAQSVAPDSRVLYVDNDPIVLAYAHSLMTSHPAGATAFIQADLRDPHQILAAPELRATLDLGKPVALMLIAVLHFLTEPEAPLSIVAELTDALPSGSYLTISHLTADFDPEEAAACEEAGQRSGITYVPRTRAQLAEFFAGLDLVDPGVAPVLTWRPDGNQPEDPAAVRMYAAMARKP